MKTDKDKPIRRAKFQELMMQQAQKLAEKEGIPLTQAMSELIQVMKENPMLKSQK